MAEELTRQKQDELVNRSMRGDKTAYRELFEAYYSRAYSLAYSIMRNNEDAEEVLQEAFVKAYLALPKFKGDSSFYTWLYRIVRNMAIDVKRKMARRPSSDYELDERVHSAVDNGTNALIQDPEKKLENKEALSYVQRALGKLKEEQRTILLLREVDGFSYDEISDITGINSGTVMSRLFYARKALQKIMQEQESQEVFIDSKLSKGTVK